MIHRREMAEALVKRSQEIMVSAGMA